MDLLQRLPRDLSWPWPTATSAQLGMLTRDLERAVTWGGRAIELAEQLGETEILVHALNNVGTAELQNGSAAGCRPLRKSLADGLDHGPPEHAARAYTNLAASTVERTSTRSPRPTWPPGSGTAGSTTSIRGCCT